MKNIFLTILAAILIVAPACSDNKTDKDNKDSRVDEKNVIKSSDVPGPVLSAFAAKYSGATEVAWENAKENDEPTYKVKFNKDGKYWKAEFKSDGTTIKEKEDN